MWTASASPSAANVRLPRFDVCAEPESLPPQLDCPVEVLHLHRQPVAAGRDHRTPRGGFSIVWRKRASPPSGPAAEIAATGAVRSIRRAGRPPAARASSASDGRASRLSPTTMPDAARAPDAAIQRCVSRLELGDGAPALVLQVQQSEALRPRDRRCAATAGPPAALHRRHRRRASDSRPVTGVPPRRRSPRACRACPHEDRRAPPDRRSPRRRRDHARCVTVARTAAASSRDRPSRRGCCAARRRWRR